MLRPASHAVYAAIFAFCMLVFGSPLHAAEPGDGEGLHCLFMGHSFFAPIVRHLPDLAARSGLENHRQMLVYHSGQTGSPGKLWASGAEDVLQAKALLETGNVEVLGLTFYPNVGSELKDYRRWIDLALTHNPETRFLIQAPWAIKKNRSLAPYQEETERWHRHIHQLVAQLQAAYPNNQFACVPQGKWMVELWRTYEQKNLPEVKEFVATSKRSLAAALFADEFGHGGDIAVRQGALLWLAAIYNVDLTQCDLSTGTQADLKGLAQQILEEDSCYQIPGHSDSEATANEAVLVAP